MSADREDPELSPAERRLRGLLEVLAVETPRPDPGLPGRVVRTVRWQRPVRAALGATGQLAGAVADGLALLLGTRRGDDRP
jgi:hypothetical protein